MTHPYTVLGRALIASAVAFTGWSAVGAWQRDTGTGHDLARDRELVRSAGQRQIAALNSMDWTRSDAGLRQWLDASTGPLHEQLRRDTAANRQKIERARTNAVATVTGAAVTALDPRAGEARLIASVRIQITPRDGAPTLQRKRYEAGLTRTPAGWKLKSLIAVPVGAR